MAVTASLLYLQWQEGSVPACGFEVFASSAAPVKHVGKDAAGHIFHQQALRQSGFLEKPEIDESVNAKGASTQSSSPGSVSEEQDDELPPGTSWKSRGKKKKGKENARPDLYALIGLKHERWMATDAQIKSAYRRVALEKHPDKCGAAVADPATKHRIEEEFKSIQEAWEILSDPARRREFDSTDHFDDSLPSDCAPELFFKVFGPAFRRNSRWSVHQPVPAFGDETSAWADVDKMYDFWYSFKSWREFPHEDEEDTDQAECREEKRWLERHNAKLREQGKKEEKKRLKQFVEDAYKRDPRVVAHKEAEKEQRERRRREKAEAYRQKEQEAEEARLAAEKKAAEEAAAAAEEAAEMKKFRAREKKAMQKERSRFRSLCTEVGDIDGYSVETLCSRSSLETLTALNTQLSLESPTAQEQRAFVQAKLDNIEATQTSSMEAREAAIQEAERAAALARKNAAEERVARAKTWSDEEVRMLEKAVVKFPQGTAKRWEQVAGYVRTRSVDEVMEMVKTGLKTGKTSTQKGGINVAKKRQANTVIHSEPSQRDQAFTDVQVNMNGHAQGSTANGHHEQAGTPNGTDRQNGAAPPKAAEASPTKSIPQDSNWTEEQEVALVKALKLYGKEKEDRWEWIAKAVPGQNKASCFKRFKQLRQAVRSNKT